MSERGMRLGSVYAAQDDEAMSVGHHEQSALAQLQNGERRLVYARYRANPDALYFLEDGTAADRKDWAKRELECFMPECTNRRLTTVSRRKKRDGFTHMSGAGGHSAESLFHQQVKIMIVRWVALKYPGLGVKQEEPTASKARRADVMVTSEDGTRQIAFEVQYSPLDVTLWQRRHDSYVEQGIRDVWLLGPSAPMLRASGPSGFVKLGDLQQAMVAAGVPVLWINPVDWLIGTPAVDASRHACVSAGCRHGESGEHWVDPRDTDTTARLIVDKFDECRLVRGEFVTPSRAGLRQAAEAWAAIRDADHNSEDARKAKEAQLRAQREAREAREREADERTVRRLHAWHEANRARLEAEWTASNLYAELLHRHKGTFPDVLAAEVDADWGVLALPAYWHSLLYASLVQDRRPTSQFTLGACLQTLKIHKVELADRRRGTKALLAFLERLAQAGLVTISRRFKATVVTVVGDIEALAARAAQAAERAEEVRRQRAIDDARLEALQARVTARSAVGIGKTLTLPLDPPALDPSHQASSDATGPRHTHCLTCGVTLDPCLSRSGYHFGCEPRR